MKKLMIAAAIVCAAAISQAASFSWLAFNEDDTALTTEGLNVYICAAGSTGFKNAGEVLAAVIGSDGNTTSLAEDMTYGGTYGMGEVHGLSDDLAGQMQDFTYVIISGDGKGYWTFDDSAEVYTTSSSHVDAETDISAMLTTAYTPFETSPEPTPEPTSGLLLLLGVAGLALKRKRA